MPRDRRQPAVIDRPKLRRTIISVVEPTEMRDGDDIAGALLHQARRWRIPVESHVRTRLVVVGRVAAKYTDQMTFAEGDDVVSALPADGADHTLSKRIVPWGLLGADDFLDAEYSHLLPKGVAVDGVTVTVEVLRLGTVAREGFDDL